MRHVEHTPILEERQSAERGQLAWPALTIFGPARRIRHSNNTFERRVDEIAPIFNQSATACCLRVQDASVTPESTDGPT